MTTYLQRVIEVTNFTKIVEELINSGFIVLHKRVECHHIRLLRIRRLIRQILEHFGDLNSSRVSRKSTEQGMKFLPELMFDEGAWPEPLRPACTPGA